MSLNPFENLCRRFLDMVHRLGQHLDVAVVELDIVGTVLERFESKCLTNDV